MVVKIFVGILFPVKLFSGLELLQIPGPFHVLVVEIVVPAFLAKVDGKPGNGKPGFTQFCVRRFGASVESVFPTAIVTGNNPISAYHKLIKISVFFYVFNPLSR